MGSSVSKIRCLFLPAQSGKTRKVEEEIIEFKRLCGIEGSRSIDIVISANNRLLVYQTSARLRKDLGSSIDDDAIDSESVISDITDDTPDSKSDAIIKGSIFSWTCGRTSNISEELLTYKLAEEEVELVMMCANKRRMTYLATLLKRLLTIKSFRRDPAKIYIWIDEADSSMGIWRQFESILENPAITQVTFVSATFGRVLKRYKSLRVIPYKQTHPDCYRRLVDCQQEIVDCGLKDPCQFVLYVLSKNPTLMSAGQRAFIPGAYTKESHYEITEELSKLGFAVVIINGERKELRIPEETTIDLCDYLSCPDPEMLPAEFNQTLAKLYKDHNLSRFPFAITGYLCIQRGVTFQCPPDKSAEHDGFVFDYGIVPSIRDKAEAYQTMARMFGNTGHFPNYVRPIIYTDEKTFAGVREQEETAVHLPQLVFEEGLESVDKADFERAAEERGVNILSRTSNNVSEYGLEEFISMDALNLRWGKLYNEKKGVKPSRQLRSPNQKEDRYVCSIGGDSKEQTVDAIRKFAIGTRSWGSGITTASPGDLISRVLVGYDGNTPVFFLRWAVKQLIHGTSSDIISHV